MSDSNQYDDDHDGVEDLGPLDDTAGVRIPVGPTGEQAPTEALPYGGDDDEVRRVEAALYARIGEQAPERRLTATRRAVELLGDPLTDTAQPLDSAWLAAFHGHFSANGLRSLRRYNDRVLARPVHGLEKMIGHLPNVIRYLRNQNGVCLTCYAAVQRYPPCVPAHYLDDEDASVRLRRRMQAFDAFRREGHGRGEPERDVVACSG